MNPENKPPTFNEFDAIMTPGSTALPRTMSVLIDLSNLCLMFKSLLSIITNNDVNIMKEEYDHSPDKNRGHMRFFTIHGMLEEEKLEIQFAFVASSKDKLKSKPNIMVMIQRESELEQAQFIEKDKAKDMLMAQVCHELRTPLSSTI